MCQGDGRRSAQDSEEEVDKGEVWKGSRRRGGRSMHATGVLMQPLALASGAMAALWPSSLICGAA